MELSNVSDCDRSKKNPFHFLTIIITLLMHKYLRTLQKFVYLSTLVLIVQSGFAQQSLTQINGWNAYVHLPWDYNSNTNTYPTIVFFPGIGEIGTNANALISNGPGAYITQGWNGNVKVGNDSVKFIVISLQPPTGYPDEYYINQNLQSIKSLYRVDPQRLYLTGLSMGAWCATTYVTADPLTGPYTYASQVMAIVDVEGVKPDDNQPYPNLFDNFAVTGGRYLGFEQSQDFRDKQTVVNRMNATRANSAIYVQTSYGGGGHCCWSSFFGGGGAQPGVYLLDGVSQNLYQWLARQRNVPPAANAGIDISINLPLNQVTLTGSGSDADGLVSKYQWSTISGPSLPVITSATSLTTAVSGLLLGTYKFQLAVTDNKGAVARDTVQVNVLQALVAPPTPSAIFGETNACPYQASTNNPSGTPVTYYINKVSSALSYTWTVPTGVTIAAHPAGTGINDTTIKVTFDNSFTGGNISVTANGVLANSTPKSLTVSKVLPATPATINGPTDVCDFIGKRLRYYTKKVNTAINYTWTVPNGCNFISNQGDTSIVVTFSSAFTGGNISVVANANCGSSPAARTLTITKNLPPQPGAITGPTEICSYLYDNVPVTYSVPLIAGVKKYNWTVTGGASILSGQGDNMITLSVPANFTNGTLSVVAQKACGASPARTINLTKTAPPTPGTISASASPCNNQLNSVTYTVARVPNTELYTWTVPSNAVIASGQGTNSIVVNYAGVLGRNQYVTVKGSSVCGTSGIKSMPIVASTSCANGEILIAGRSSNQPK